MKHASTILFSATGRRGLRTLWQALVHMPPRVHAETLRQRSDGRRQAIWPIKTRVGRYETLWLALFNFVLTDIHAATILLDGEPCSRT